MRLGYVCTNFNSSDVTVRAVKTLLANVGHEVHIVVVDNDSRSEERAVLETIRSATVDVLLLGKNLGYFAGLNMGIRRLRESVPGIEWMVVGNNDLEFPPDFCAKLEAVAPEIARYPVVSPDIVTGDGEHQNPHVISHISKVREVFYDLYYSNYYLGLLVQMLAQTFQRLTDRSDEQQWQVARTIYQGHGSAYILGPRFFELFEELWAPTFLMSEEFFLSKQLSDVGEQVYYEPRISLRHMWHASFEGLPSRRRWEFARDAHRVYRRHVKIWK